MQKILTEVTGSNEDRRMPDSKKNERIGPGSEGEKRPYLSEAFFSNQVEELQRQRRLSDPIPS